MTATVVASGLVSLLILAAPVGVALGATISTSSGPNFPSSATDGGGASVAWVSVEKVEVSNNQYAYADMGGAHDTDNRTHSLLATDFGFSVPTTATITGVQISIERNCTSCTDGTGNEAVYDKNIKLIQGGVVTGNDEATSTAWSRGTDRTDSYGATDDLWGLTLTPADVNSSDFGVSISAKKLPNDQGSYNGNDTYANIDSVTITVYYTLTLTEQTITFDTIANATYGDSAIALNATSTSGLTVSFSTPSSANICTVSGSSVTLTGVGTCEVDADQAGDSTYDVASTTSHSFTISPKTITVSGIATTTKVYDGGTSASFTGTPTFSTLVGADTLGLTASYADKNVGTDKPLTFALTDGTGSAANYSLTDPALTADITKHDLSITANDLADATRVYNGTTTVALNSSPTYSFDALQGSDTAGTDVTLVAGTSTLDSKDVGSRTASFGGYMLGGSSGGNYNLLNQPGSETQTVTTYPITVSAAYTTKVYDGDTTSTGTPTFTSGSLQGSDTATLTETYGTKDAGGSGTKIVTPSASISDGNNGANYDVTYVNDTTSTITRKPITLTGLTIQSKVYDATTVATAGTSSVTLVGVLPADTADVAPNFASATYTFSSKHVGTGKDVAAAGVTLDGSESGNYSLTQPSSTGDITTYPITVTATTSSKVYDRDTTSTSTPSITSGILQGSDTATLTETYDNKKVATGKVMTPSASISDGNGGANYDITYVNDLTGEITGKTLTVTATGVDKTYDATTTATAVYGDDRVSGDLLIVSGTAVFDTPDIGSGKDVYVTGIGISGTDAGNYVLGNTTATTTAAITVASVTPTITPFSKVYDGTTAATSTCAVTPFGTDDLSCVIGGSDTFDIETVGTPRTVTATGITLSGADAAKYVLTTSTSTGTAAITQAGLTVSFTTDVSKVYDATTTAALLTSTIESGIIGRDDVSVSGGTASFENKTVAVGKAVNATGFTLSGADSANYSIATINATTSDITAAPLDIAFTAENKTFDGTTAATIATSSITSGILSGDFVTVSGGVATFSDASVGTGKTVSASGFTFGDTDGGNYAVGTVATTTADIIAAPSSGGNGPIAGSLGGGGGSFVLGASVYNFTTDFGLGDSGTDVTELQKILIAEGLLKIETPTGYFGPLTESAVKQYQAAHGITPQSGYVGPKTRAELNKGTTPTLTDEQKALIIQNLQQQLEILLAKIAELLQATSSGQ